MIPAAQKPSRFVGNSVSIRFGAHRLPLHIVSALKKQTLVAKNCGVGSEGFEAGNDCGAGDGSGGSGVNPKELIAENRNAIVEENGDITIDIGTQSGDLLSDEMNMVGEKFQGEIYIPSKITEALAKEVVESGTMSETYIANAEAYCLEPTGQKILEMQASTREGETVESVFRKQVLILERARIGRDYPVNVERVEAKVAQLVGEFNAKRDSIVADARTTLPREMIVHRGFSINGEETKKWLGAARAGDSVEMGVMSTSQNPAIASIYGNFGNSQSGSVLLKISTTRGMVGQASERVNTEEGGNQEIVIAPKSIKIKSIQKIKTRRDVGDATPLETTSYMIDCEAVY